MEVARRGCCVLSFLQRASSSSLKFLSARCFCSVSNESTGTGKWVGLDSQRQALEEISKQLNVSKLADWYSIPRRDVMKCGGKGLFSHYTSLADALKALYPEYPWDPARFIKGWQNRDNLLRALSHAEQQLGIETAEDWHSVNLSDLKEFSFPRGMSKVQLAELLKEKYPDHNWEPVYLLKGKFAQQKRLEKTVTSLFEGENIIINARKEADLINPDTGNHLELDVYIPSLRLAFEYQERHHYTSSAYTYDPLEVIQARDEKKQILANSKGITLIIVPCWWDGAEESLVASIQEARPDLLLQFDSRNAQPIPKNAPPGYFEKTTPSIEGIGQPTNACFFTLSKIDPTNWWMFEKYDGVRGFWNPEKRMFYSRNGKPLVLPPAIVDTMPGDIFLDGELWFGEDNFQEALKVSGKGDFSRTDWKRFRYMIFDIPKDSGTYGQRFMALEQYMKTNKSPYIRLARKELCSGANHLERFFQEIIDKGGEGVILRDPRAPYQSGRCPGFLKHKKFRDAEARVIGAAGSYQWECELPNGVRFTAPAGTTEFAQRRHPMPGDIVTFKHRGFLQATMKPKLPTLYRIRTDLDWEDIKRNWSEQKYTATAWYPPVQRDGPQARQPNYWHDINHRRKFFQDVAKEMGFNVDSIEHWQRITTTQIIAKKGRGPLALYNGSLMLALSQTFPELNFKAQPRSKGYWLDINNRRSFFQQFAEEKGFDPADGDSWKNVTVSQVWEKKGYGLLAAFKGSLVQALRQTYPELKL